MLPITALSEKHIIEGFLREYIMKKVYAKRKWNLDNLMQKLLQSVHTIRTYNHEYMYMWSIKMSDKKVLVTPLYFGQVFLFSDMMMPY